MLARVLIIHSVIKENRRMRNRKDEGKRAGKKREKSGIARREPIVALASAVGSAQLHWPPSMQLREIN